MTKPHKSVYEENHQSIVGDTDLLKSHGFFLVLKILHQTQTYETWRQEHIEVIRND